MKNLLRVLIVEDAAPDAELLVRELTRGGWALEWERVETAAALGDALDRRRWDVVISDYGLPDFDGLSALQLLQQRGLDLPFIIVSGMVGDEEAVGAMKAGAHDYVMKDKLARLVPAVKRELREAEERRERRRAQEALRESEQRYKSLFDHNPDAVFSLDREGRFFSANPAAELLTGYAAAELRNRSFLELCAPDQLETTRRVFQQGWQGAITGLETALISREGRRVELFVTGGPIMVDGQAVAIFGIAKNVTERKRDQQELEQAHQELERRVQERTAELGEANRQLRAGLEQHEQIEAALRASEERYRRLVEVSPEAIFIHRENKIVFINRAGLQLFGANTQEQMLGKSLFDLVHPDSQRTVRERIRYATLHGQTVPLVEEKIIRLDGTVIDAEMAAGPFTDQGVTAIQVVLRDITGRKRLEKEILEAGERERQRMGRDLHDGLCQHLTGVKFKSSLLEMKLAEQSLPEAREARAIARLMDQALREAHDLAQGLHPVKLEAHGLMAALHELAARIGNVFHVACVCRFPKPVLMQDHAAAIHLYRIAQEAISNGIKHGKAKIIRLGLTATPTRVTLTVQDDGLGFPAKQPRGKKGGMGLHLMNHRARLIGARLILEPGPSGGTLLTCAWPRPVRAAARKK